MLSDYDFKIIKAINENFKLANQSIKGCYFKKCTDRPIKSHSISKRKILEKIAENGTVMMLGSDCFITGQAKEVGINQATTLKAFCHAHDQAVFAPIDNEKYIPQNKEQEFLFAMRAAARELHTKRAATMSSETWNHDLDSLELDDFNYGQRLSVKDQGKTRTIFLDTYAKQKYNVIETAVLSLDIEAPIAASSSFNMEIAYNNTIINDVTESGYNTEMKPCFLTLFPQDGKTYCIVSYFRKHRKDYSFLQELRDKTEIEKEIIISNLIIGYIENFVVAPSYWSKILSNIPDLIEIFCQMALTPRTSFIEYENLNIFSSL